MVAACIHVALMTDSTAKAGVNVDFAGAYICPAVNNIENHVDASSVLATCVLFKRSY